MSAEDSAAVEIGTCGQRFGADTIGFQHFSPYMARPKFQSIRYWSKLETELTRNILRTHSSIDWISPYLKRFADRRGSVPGRCRLRLQYPSPCRSRWLEHGPRKKQMGANLSDARYIMPSVERDYLFQPRQPQRSQYPELGNLWTRPPPHHRSRARLVRRFPRRTVYSTISCSCRRRATASATCPLSSRRRKRTPFSSHA